MEVINNWMFFVPPGAVILTLIYIQITQTLVISAYYDSAGLGCGPRLCMSNKLPECQCCILGTILWVSKPQKIDRTYRQRYLQTRNSHIINL